MIYSRLGLPELVLIEMELVEDARGFFARCFDREEMRSHGLVGTFEQESLSRNVHRGTLRGLHYQREPHGETKLVRCVRGRIFDVVVDIRPESVSYGHWTSIVLDASTPASLYIPAGFAHGYQTLDDASDVYYHITPAFAPESAAGISAFSPRLGIPWPLDVTAVSERDRDHRNFE